MSHVSHWNDHEAIEKKEKTSVIFLDFAKAFDNVNHIILLKKLEYYIMV